MSTPEPDHSEDDLGKVIQDFTRDVLTTFPECAESLDARLEPFTVAAEREPTDAQVEAVRVQLREAYPSRFFDILYQNDEMFSKDEALEFLPGIDFRALWASNISDATRKTIWKYLQLVLFTLVAKMEDGASFGEAASLFEAIDPEEFRSKLSETIDEMQSCFSGEQGQEGEAGEEGSCEGDSQPTDLPDPEVLHEHVKEMMGGKLGQLAHEIAEEAASELGLDAGKATDHKSAFKELMKNPMKLMGLVKKVGGKLNEKIKSGEIKEAELLQEATEMVERMKSMPGMGGLESLLRRGGGKPDLAAMQAHLQRNTRMATQRDRMRAKLAERQRNAPPAPPAPPDGQKDPSMTGCKKKRRKKKKQRAK